jgi:electron transfer flavoprotein beta subunit
VEIRVCVKPLPDAETRLRPDAAGAGPDLDGAKWVLAGYDESAVEQALLLKESVPGSTVRAFSFAPAPRGEEVLRAALALGCDAATWVEQPKEVRADSILTARALALAIGKQPFDLVLTGKQALDDETGAVPSALGEILDVPSFSYVTQLKADPGTRRLSFRRAVEGGLEAVEAPWPAVVGLQEAWNDPRTAKLQSILKSRRATIDKVPWSEVGAALGEKAAPRTKPVKFVLPAARTGAKMIEFSTPEEAAQKLVRLLKEEAKVFP